MGASPSRDSVSSSYQKRRAARLSAQSIKSEEPEVSNDELFDNSEDQSVKFAISKQLPAINDATTFRKARRILKELGGAQKVLDELISLGFVDASTGQLTTGETPFNPI